MREELFPGQGLAETLEWVWHWNPISKYLTGTFDKHELWWVS